MPFIFISLLNENYLFPFWMLIINLGVNGIFIEPMPFNPNAF